MFWPSEINDLAALCSEAAAGRAFSIETMPDGAGATYWPDGLVDDLGWVIIK
jgi:hypothetical protein